MATHSSSLAWKIPWLEAPGRLQSMGSQRVGHNWLHFLSFYSFFWRRKWQPTPVFLPGESHGWRGLVGYSLWGGTESGMTKQLTHVWMQSGKDFSVAPLLKAYDLWVPSTTRKHHQLWQRLVWGALLLSCVSQRIRIRIQGHLKWKVITSHHEDGLYDVM